jgi:hypothetical protein
MRFLSASVSRAFAVVRGISPDLDRGVGQVFIIVLKRPHLFILVLFVFIFGRTLSVGVRREDVIIITHLLIGGCFCRGNFC